jgi:tryptophan synthase alpha chain
VSRLATRFAALKSANRAGFIAYVMAGDPDAATSLQIMRAAVAGGADVLELGFPFTDPMADGPTIQNAGLRALKAGTTLKTALDLVAKFRAEDATTPVILMGYANPVEAMGAPAFAASLATAGGDGVILVDLPPEEDHATRATLSEHGLSLIRLATPTTDDARLPAVLEGVSGFLYYVSMTGVTGAAAIAAEGARAAVTRLKKSTALPVAVGFGIRTPEAAAEIAKIADAVVVGSALVAEVAAAVESGKPEDAPARVERATRTLAQAIAAARQVEQAKP